jgi:hypothetical protein
MKLIDGRDDSAGPDDTAPSRTCSVCGCTDLDCRQCIEATGEPCHWVWWDLCSRCQRRFIRTFQPGFVPAVERGLKTQTVRPRPKRMPRPGDIIECRYWSGKPYRSKPIWCAEGLITNVATIRIEESRIDCPDIWVEQWLHTPESGAADRSAFVCECRGAGWLQAEQLEEFAQADGFESATDLCRWFKGRYKLPFEGVLMQWERLGLSVWAASLEGGDDD